MNAHNEQHDPASAVVKQNLTTQPAAAQEAVLRIYAEGNMRVVAEWLDGSRDLPDGDHRLYAAPVTAAPADTWFADQLTAMGEVIPLDGTPAAPGIDLTPFRELADAWQKESSEALGQFPPIEGNHRSQMIRLGKCAHKLHNLIDASPKGNHFPDATKMVDSPKGGSDPWRGLYASDRTPNRDEYGCFYHPDIPSWDDEREESIAPLLKAQGFDLQCVPGDFSDEAMEEGGERYWKEMRSWNPEPNGDGWRLVAIYDTEDGPYAMFVKPLAQASDAEVRP